MMMVEYSQIMLMQVCIFQREFWIQEPTKKKYIFLFCTNKPKIIVLTSESAPKVNAVGDPLILYTPIASSTK